MKLRLHILLSKQPVYITPKSSQTFLKLYEYLIIFAERIIAVWDNQQYYRKVVCYLKTLYDIKPVFICNYM